jgi:hypothetical protein
VRASRAGRKWCRTSPASTVAWPCVVRPTCRMPPRHQAVTAPLRPWLCECARRHRGAGVRERKAAVVVTGGGWCKVTSWPVQSDGRQPRHAVGARVAVRVRVRARNVPRRAGRPCRRGDKAGVEGRNRQSGARASSKEKRRGFRTLASPAGSTAAGRVVPGGLGEGRSPGAGRGRCRLNAASPDGGSDRHGFAPGLRGSTAVKRGHTGGRRLRWTREARGARRGRGLARRRSRVAWPCGLVPIAGRCGGVVVAAPRRVPVNGDLRGCDVVRVAVHDELGHGGDGAERGVAPCSLSWGQERG